MLTHHLPALRRPGAQLLAIGAHADDIEIGAGGTVLQLLSVAPATVDVRWVVLSATPARAEEARASAAAFCSDARSVTVDVHDLPAGRFPAEWGTLKETLQALAAETDPDLVLTTRPGDAHQDHRLLATMMPTAFRDHAIWGYEIPKYDGDTTQPSLYVPLDEESWTARSRSCTSTSRPSRIATGGTTTCSAPSRDCGEWRAAADGPRRS